MSTGMWGVKNVTVMPGMFKKWHVTDKVNNFAKQQNIISFRLRLNPKVFLCPQKVHATPRCHVSRCCQVRASQLGTRGLEMCWWWLLMTMQKFSFTPFLGCCPEIFVFKLEDRIHITSTESKMCLGFFIPVPGRWLLDSAHYLPYHPGCRFTWPVRNVAALCWPGAIEKLYENLWAKRFALSSFSFLFVEVWSPQILNTLSKQVDEVFIIAGASPWPLGKHLAFSERAWRGAVGS